MSKKNIEALLNKVLNLNTKNEEIESLLANTQIALELILEKLKAEK